MLIVNHATNFHVLSSFLLCVNFVLSASPETHKSSAPSPQTGDCNDQIRDLESRVLALEEGLKLSLRRELHLSTLLNFQLHPVMSEQEYSLAEQGTGALPVPLDMSLTCPSGSLAIRTRTAPRHIICVHIAPHFVDASISTAGSWGDGEELRNWIMLLGWMGVAHGVDVRLSLQNLIVLDVGAHIGTASVFLAMLRGYQSQENYGIGHELEWVFPNLHIVAIEPDMMHASMINASAHLNNIEKNILVVTKAAYNRTGSQVVYHRCVANSGANYISSAGSAYGPIGGPIEGLEDLKPRSSHVESIALDDLKLDSTQFIVLKIDVELAETEVLQGARRLFENGRIMLVHVEVSSNLNNGGQPLLSVFRFLLDYDFVCLCGGACAEHVPIFAWSFLTIDNIDAFAAALGHHFTDVVFFHRRIIHTRVFGDVDLKEAYERSHQLWKAGYFFPMDL